MVNVYKTESWLGREPEIPETAITATLEADVIVVGGGLAGVSAVRQAAELGASVLLFEKCETVQGRTGDFTTFDSQLAQTWGRSQVDKVSLVNDLMREMGYKASQTVLKKWAQHAGEAFDWYVGAYPDLVVLQSSTEPPPQGCKCWVQPKRYPVPDSFDENKPERFKCYQYNVFIRPTHVPVLKANLAAAESTGNVQAFYSTRVLKLLRRDGGRVQGIIAQAEDGGYIRALAKSGVILATGDFMNDKKMLQRFLPYSANTPQYWNSYDKNDNPSNTGDGHKMGLWAGAKLQDQPPAPLAHHMGSVFGCSDFLMLDSRGLRFVNEDIPGLQIHEQLETLPDKTAWQFVDSNWRQQIPHVYLSHGTVSYVIEDEKFDSGEVFAGLNTTDNIVSPRLIEAARESGRLLRANTLEDLIERTGLPQETALASIERYNALCRNKNDQDFGKDPTRMFPVEKGPFYAAKFTPANLLAVLFGLQCDEETRVYDTAGKVIPGLYAAGNVQGNRVAVGYPLTVPGFSHSLALPFGRIAGMNAAKGV